MRKGAHHAAANFAEGSSDGTDRTAALLHRTTGEYASAAIRAAGQLDLARSDHHHGRRDRQPCLDGMGYAVWSECRPTAEAADGGRLHGISRWTDLSAQAARRAEVARRGTGTGAGL